MPQKFPQKIYLIGMPGAGKSTLGLPLAALLQYPFVDLDTEIEKQEGCPVPDIFSSKGEDYFRLLESKLLHTWARSEGTFVMATGGGAPCFHQGINIINKTGTSLFLDIPVDELLARLHTTNNRPLLANTDRRVKLETLRNSRLPVYQQAHIHITDNATPAEVQNLLLG